MKKLLTLIAIVLAVGVSSCSKFDDSAIWDKLNEQEQTLNDHEKRIAALEELCKQMNTNIDALQTLVEALEKRDYITNVSPVRKDGEVIGYTISFADSDTITIYHGENGQDGADAKDGYTPQIGVMKDTDGIYYWTLDGEWLLDGKGNKIQANGVNGIDGTNGSNGQDGTNGVDGITPRLKIENDYWYVSYDNGVTWVELGKATGENGSNGIDGVDGDSIFSSVTQDDEYVYFNLADGTMITLPKHDKENIQFEDLLVKSICCKHWDTNNDGELSYAEAAAVADIGTVFKGNKDIIAFNELKYFTGISFLPASAFSGCTNLWKIIIPDNVIIIMEKAFYECSQLSNINIPDRVTTIGGQAFFYCSEIKDFIIPHNVTSIGGLTFSGCSGTIYINCPIPDYYAYHSSSSSSPYTGSSFDEIIIGDEVTSIGEYAFAYSNPKCVHISSNVNHIGKCAFYYMSGLTEISIPDNVSTVPEFCFYRCYNLEVITIGKNVTRIEPDAFNTYSDIKAIYCKPITPPNVDYFTSDTSYNIFPYNSELKIYVPSESYATYTTEKGNPSNQSNWYDYRNYMHPYNFD